MDNLVTTQWLAEHLGESDLRVVDATLFLPGSDRDAAAEYETAHIPGAFFLNLSELVDTNDSRPGMLPPPGVPLLIWSMSWSRVRRVPMVDKSGPRLPPTPSKA